MASNAHKHGEVQGWFSPLVMVAGIDPNRSGLAAGAFTCQLTSTASLPSLLPSLLPKIKFYLLDSPIIINNTFGRNKSILDKQKAVLVKLLVTENLVFYD